MDYQLNDAQVRALYALLVQINLSTLERCGEIHSHGRKISPEEGKVIFDLYRDEKFYSED